MRAGGIRADRREVLRYMGYGRGEADGRVLQLVEEVLSELGEAASPRHVLRVYPLLRKEDGLLDLGAFETRSGNLSKNLEGCEQVALFAATLGMGPDRMLYRYGKLEVSRAVATQAAAAAMLEAYCDEISKDLGREQEGRGFFLRPRFSPGYGDFPLECQSLLLRSLDAERRAGIHLTDSLLMQPTKSVSGVIGLSRRPRACPVRGCEACGAEGCEYRMCEEWKSDGTD